jgi:uncharacterized membrane protein
VNPRAINLSETERWVSSVTGAMMALSGLRQRSLRGTIMAASGVALVARGATGYCPVTDALGRHADEDAYDSRRALAGSGGVNVEESITISKPGDELYRIWRDLDTLPRYIPELASVTRLDDTRSRWEVKGPGGRTATWEAEVFNDVPNETIAWRTVGLPDVVSAGSVRFTPVAGRPETQVHVRLQYDPPGGKAGASLAWLFGRAPGQLIRDFLRRFKASLESGEVPTTEGQPRGRQSMLNYQ